MEGADDILPRCLVHKLDCELRYSHSIRAHASPKTRVAEQSGSHEDARSRGHYQQPPHPRTRLPARDRCRDCHSYGCAHAGLRQGCRQGRRRRRRRRNGRCLRDGDGRSSNSSSQERSGAGGQRQKEASGASGSDTDRSHGGARGSGGGAARRRRRTRSMADGVIRRQPLWRRRELRARPLPRLRRHHDVLRMAGVMNAIAAAGQWRCTSRRRRTRRSTPPRTIREARDGAARDRAEGGAGGGHARGEGVGGGGARPTSVYASSRQRASKGATRTRCRRARRGGARGRSARPLAVEAASRSPASAPTPTTPPRPH